MANIEPQWITEASARSYKLAQNCMSDLDPFQFNVTIRSNAYLKSLFNSTPGYEELREYGRYPGTWTLPVCNASTCGKAWNWDYSKQVYQASHPPCMCGKSHTPRSWERVVSDEKRR